MHTVFLINKNDIFLLCPVRGWNLSIITRWTKHTCICMYVYYTYMYSITTNNTTQHDYTPSYARLQYVQYFIYNLPLNYLRQKFTYIVKL